MSVMADDAPRVAVVTGAASGMGRACSVALLDIADVLVLVDRDVEQLRSAAQALPDSIAITRVADVTDAEQLTAVSAQVQSLGTFRALAHAAGVSPTMADWRAIIEVDLVGTALVLEALRPLVCPGSAAVCFASMASQLVIPTADPAIDFLIDAPLDPDLLDKLVQSLPSIKDPALAYAWAKRGVQRLARSEAMIWGPQGGRVCSISPGMVATPMGAQEEAAHPEMAALRDVMPIPRMATAGEVADATAFLLSDRASYLTAIDLLVDGGATAAFQQLI
jgi:NAD(P)-dependent dehydrogenase (short-subunit alcohol dehydrogenase family)